MRVLSIAYAFAPVHRGCVGGAEQVLASMDRALTARGHTSVVVAAAGSETDGTAVLWQPPAGPLDTADERTSTAAFQAAIDRALTLGPFDLVHFHGLDFWRYQLPPGLPSVVTLHLPLHWYPDAAWTPQPNRQFCCVSASQHRNAPLGLEAAAVVPNGVALTPVPNYQREHYALVLGRICPEKNMHAALDAGTEANLPVWIAGEVFPYRDHQAYFADFLAPRLASPTGPRHQFLGAVSPEERTSLLARARCLLHPTLAPETSSLVAMEALAAGTPVIAYGSGALPEIIDDGRTGFLVDSPAEMARSIARVDEIDAETCREAARTRFSEAQMIAGYLAQYDLLLSRTEVLAHGR